MTVLQPPSPRLRWSAVALAKAEQTARAPKGNAHARSSPPYDTLSVDAGVDGPVGDAGGVDGGNVDGAPVVPVAAAPGAGGGTRRGRTRAALSGLRWTAR